ncbi:zinc finger protein 567-like [Phymastichus coffea]|uniref:zinc finger protein 567-like n=1 Tax=Phymastichus coffea TaxID=108790 RepID=UPI00273C6E08|nr:zinc finger protein 567-like [Phymastichus coffea]
MEQHSCPQCGATFPKRTLLKRHVLRSCKFVRRQCDVYECNSCPYRSNYKANIERHVRNLHPTGTESLEFQCQLCDFRNDMIEALFHPCQIKLELQGNPAVPTPVQNRRGKITPLEYQNFMCGQCGKGYKWMENLQRHQRLECGKSPKFVYDTMLTSLWITPADEAEVVPVKSEIKSVDGSEPLTSIIEDMEEFYLPTPPSFECEQLWPLATTLALSTRKRSRRTKDSPQQKDLKCLNCNKQFSRIDSLNRHKKLYSIVIEEEFICLPPVTQKSQAFDLSAARDEQFDEASYIYQRHGKTYLEQPIQKLHEKYGGDVPKFFCNYCNYSCTSKSNMLNHIRTHCLTTVRIEHPKQSEKSYICETCGKVYASKGGLCNHRKYVCGKEPSFFCMYCDRIFAHKGNLNEHINNRHKPNDSSFKYQCLLCGKSYKYKRGLVRHSKYGCKQFERLTPATISFAGLKTTSLQKQ